jgi:drug/metabolite transporter (DMT)-like permease
MALAFFSAVCFGAMAVLTRKFIQRIQLVSVNALRLWLAVALWFVFNGVPEELFEISPAQAGYTCLAAFFGPFLGRLSLMMSARYMEARFSALVMLAAPPVTLVLAYLLLNDLPRPREILGGLIMLVGISIPILAWARPGLSQTWDRWAR